MSGNHPSIYSVVALAFDKVQNTKRSTTMRIHIGNAVLITALCVAAQLPAFADTTWFETYDLDHTGYWTWPEYQKATVYYYEEHPKVVKLSEGDLHKQFETLDVDRHGYVTRQQVETVYHWE
jgi:hypothetical protein